MIRAAVGLSTHQDTARAAIEAGSQVAARLGGPADWCIAFASYDHAPHVQTLQETLAGVIDTPYVVGCSGAGVIAAGREVEDGPAVGVLGVVSDRLRGTPFLFHDEGDRGMSAGVRLGQRLQNSRDTGDVVLAWPDPFTVRPDELLRALDALIGNVPVIGGAAAAGGGGQRTFQFCGSESNANSVAGLRVGGEVRHVVGVTQGCRALSAPLRVTRCHENLILEVEGRPALEVLYEHAPDGLMADPVSAFNFLFVGLLPGAPDEVGPEEYLVRNIVATDPSAGVLGISDRVTEGQSIVFALREPEAARSDVSRMLADLAPARTGVDYGFGLYFNCLARGRSLYRQEGVDSELIAQAFPDLPVLGFFCNAELGPMRGQNQLFTYTGVLSLFGE